MNAQNYLQSVLKDQTLPEDSTEIKQLRKEKAKVESCLKQAFNEQISIRYAGSYIKGTMIRGSYDLDITCYFEHDNTAAGETLKEIYNSVKDALSKCKYTIEEKRSAIKLWGNSDIDFRIDVVPGRFVDDTKTDIYLYQALGEKTRLKTNLDKHIAHIKNSKLQGTIKLIKYWKYRYGLQNIKTFILELLIIKVLENKEDGEGLDVCLTTFFEKIKDDINNIVIEDPANSGNDLSELFDVSVKNSLALTAEQTFKLINDDKWEDIFGEVAKINSADKSAALKNISDRGPDKWSS